MNLSRLLYLSLVLVFISPAYLWSQSAWERSVLLSAVVNADPPSIELQWPQDFAATDYQVFRKALDADNWGMELASLAGTATSFSDTEVEVGKIYEYALFKKNFDPVVQQVCVESDAALEFAINDMYGIGLCCNFGFGYYEVKGCGQQLAYGDNFGFADTTYFSLCNTGSGCEDLTITLIPDMFPNSTSWTLKNQNTGELLASSGPVGTFISERPKYGFISAGIEVAPRIESRGTLLLLVEKTLSDSLAMEIAQLKLDLIKDHWQVVEEVIEVDEEVTAVRAKIQAQYQNLPDLKALYLLGHIPVPYSGNIYPDTHSENHQGAWSADPYYAELNGNWTDEVANITTAFFERNHNIPGDGKFDQDSIPSKVELQMGRVDLSNMPAFAADEIELTRRYLQKAHAYKTGLIDAERRALIDDNFGQAFAAPAASGWRNFAPMFGADQIVEADYFETMRQAPYLWSYGCGSGSHLSSAGIGNTSDFAQDSLQNIFTMLFGSQFGDWDNPDNFLRAPLASGATLTNCWAGSPPWTFHHMALGFPIGYSAFRSMNSIDGVYLNGPQLVHMALLGDPSLRMFMVPPLREGSLQLESQSDVVQLRWEAATGADIIGYWIYRAEQVEDVFTPVHSTLLTDTFWVDTDPLLGMNYYQVKAVRLEASASGTYYNQSLGILDSVYYSPIVSTNDPLATKTLELFPNPSSGIVQVQFPKNRTPEPQSLRLFHADGKAIQNWTIGPNAEIQTLNLQHLSNGVYYLEYEGSVYRLVLAQ